MLQTKIPILTSLYHIDLWPEFLEIFLKNKNLIVPYVGLCEDNDNLKVIEDLKNHFDQHQYVICKNAGADVMPFLTMLNNIDENKYPFFIKIHAKKSTWGSHNHVNWRHILINDLLSDDKLIERNVKILQKDSVGMITNKFLCLNNREHTNVHHIKTLCNLLNINYQKIKNSYFPAGNMFMSKTSIFKKYFSKNVNDIIVHLLQNEVGKIADTYRGTYSHALERIFGYIIKYDNKKIAYPAHKSIKILNKIKDKKHYFHLVVIDNKTCYVQEDINIYGNIIDTTPDSIIIEWLHVNNIVKVEYKKISSNTIVKHKLL